MSKFLMDRYLLNRRIREIVAHVVRHRFKLVSVPAEVAFYDLAIDPVERVYIAQSVEEEWNIALTDAEIDAWNAFEDIEISIMTKLGVPPGPIGGS